MKPHLFLCIFIAIATCCWGQSEVDSVDSKSDELPVFMEDTVISSKEKKVTLVEDFSSHFTNIYHYAVVQRKSASPALAGGLSAAFPGAGQFYNKKYWKIPINYAGFVATGYFIYHFNKEYVYYRTAYRHLLKGEKDLVDPSLQGWDKDNINWYKQYHQKNMEYSILALVVWYFINILDAVVDAHLMSFDVSDNLALRIAPNINPTNFGYRQTAGVSFTMSFKPLKR